MRLELSSHLKVAKKKAAKDALSKNLSELHRYKLEISYIGKDFYGFQRQATGQSVQACLESALEIILKHPVSIQASSRTDSGVHAFQQVAAFSTKVPYSSSWLASLNALTPRSIGIYKLDLVEDGFCPIKLSKAKIYRYQIHNY
mgnify:CR=1 FL=1